jgi:DNA-directed RNA polymerase specialized sigma24 family protein
MAIMAMPPLVSDVEEFDLNKDSTWKKLYPLLESLAQYFVYSSNIPSWQGQEVDIIDDIVQETVRRIIERSQKADRGEAAPIQSLKSMLFAVAHNYCKDLRRRDRRLLRVQPQDAPFQGYLDRRNQVNLEEAGVENVYQEELFKLVACEVSAFPNKQRQAILIDLANRMHFSKRPTPLQQAFLDADIDLREYKRALRSTPQERSRHAALVNYAYKRVTCLQQVQRYIALT